MTIGERIKARRKELKLSADIVAEKLGVSRSTIFRYEKGDIEKLPTNILENIAIILHTSPAYLMGWEENGPNITILYNKLNAKNQKLTYNFAERRLEEQSQVNSLSLHQKTHQKDHFRLFDWCGYVSAETGEYLDGEDIRETIQLLEEDIPETADFALTVNGDSMKPVFKNHETIFIEKTTDLPSGSIGIVIVENEAYLKKIYIHDDCITLVSLNPAYKNIIIKETDAIKVVGRVVI